MSEGRRDSTGITLLLAVVLVAGAGSYLAFRSDAQRRERLVAEAPATVLDVYVARGGGSKVKPSSGFAVSVTITYRYTVGGETRTRTAVMNSDMGGRYKVASPAKVCYDPANPDYAELVLAEQRCGA